MRFSVANVNRYGETGRILKNGVEVHKNQHHTHSLHFRIEMRSKLTSSNPTWARAYSQKLLVY